MVLQSWDRMRSFDQGPSSCCRLGVFVSLRVDDGSYVFLDTAAGEMKPSADVRDDWELNLSSCEGGGEG